MCPIPICPGGLEGDDLGSIEYGYFMLVEQKTVVYMDLATEELFWEDEDENRHGLPSDIHENDVIPFE
jgi:hypothetical protein